MPEVEDDELCVCGDWLSQHEDEEGPCLVCEDCDQFVSAEDGED